MINWKVRFKNRLWVVAVLSQLFLLVELLLAGAHTFGWTDFALTEQMKEWVLAVVNAIFMVLATLGVVQDPTTGGMEDSARAKNYDSPQ